MAPVALAQAPGPISEPAQLVPTESAAPASASEDLYVIWQSALVAVPMIPEAPKLPFDPKSCVSYVVSRRPDLNVGWVTPKHFYETHGMLDHPFPGAVGISAEGPVWHAWYVEEVFTDHMLITETNYLGDFKSSRSMPLDAEVIRGYR